VGKDLGPTKNSFGKKWVAYWEEGWGCLFFDIGGREREKKTMKGKTYILLRKIKRKVVVPVGGH